MKKGFSESPCGYRTLSLPLPTAYPPKLPLVGELRWPVTVARNPWPLPPSLNVVPLMVKALVEEIVSANAAVKVPATGSAMACWCSLDVCTGMPDRNESGFAKLAGALFK